MIRHALVLTAGLGTRLRPLTDVRAKPALPVAGEPLIRRIIRWLASRGVTDLVLNLHHRPDTLAAVVGDGTDLSVRVRYSWEQPRVLGSAGGPRLALPLLDADTFFIVNGDTLTDVDLGDLANAHMGSGALVTLALVPNRAFDRYGGVQLDAGGRVAGFVRRGPSAAGSYHYIGVQIAHGSAFAALAPGIQASSIGEVYDALMARSPGSVRGLVCDAAFWDVGTPADYWWTSRAFARPVASDDRAGHRSSGATSTSDAREDTSSTVGQRARIDPAARVLRSILWDDVEVGAGALVDECIVTDGAAIAPHAEYRRAILVRRADGGVTATPLALDHGGGPFA
jgi:mannose-1-phosphate guanylyltransferase